MKLIYEKDKLDPKEEMEHVNGLEQKVARAYENIPKTT
jgi:hypothetical protein